ncbi:MAG: gliding motility-associated C-terminal domain-containing protein [Flavobacteriales bacterium]|nr:gliding motility-associated C-terminal domain-containing protein [Flavobacteriales bacterium]
MVKRLLLFGFVFMNALLIHATHNRAGEITYKHLFGLRYEITVTIFADPNSNAIARKEIEINWGDNTGLDSLVVSNQVDVIPGLIKKRQWKAEHTFPGPGTYNISVTDPNRNGGVDNIENSSTVPFYVESLLKIFPFSGIYNDSPVLLNDPIDDACLGQTFIHNPGAVDPDGDSLAYEISQSLGLAGNIAPGYVFPPASNRIYVNAITGDLIWENPTEIGIYNIAIIIKEYRNGVLIGKILRDLQIVVYPGCNNNPPSILVNRENCIEAGKTITVPIQSFDQDPSDVISLNLTGELFGNNLPNPAVVNYGSVSNPAFASIIWNTICDNIRPESYKSSIKAIDNGLDRGSTNLSSFENTEIKVVGPAIQNFKATKQGKAIALTWDISNCNNAIGYRIYKRKDSSGFVPSACQIGVPEFAGYTFLNHLAPISSTSYLDEEEIVPGQKYCYLITAVFNDNYEGYASAETCASIEKVVPIITKVSIESTDNLIGSIDLAWSPPDTIDVISFPSPYKYLIYHIEENGQMRLIDSTNSINDTSLILNNYNTKEKQHTFLIELYSYGLGRTLAGSTALSPSVFLKTEGIDNQVILTWNNNFPWQNDSFIVYRENKITGLFDSIAIVSEAEFTDKNLKNGTEYCYYVKSIGAYNLVHVKNPIVNKSQRVCAIPIDEEPPCQPVFQITGDCNFNSLTISWNNPNLTCSQSQDVIGYKVYKSVTKDGAFELLETLIGENNTTLTKNLNSIAGCYQVLAIDSAGNESITSNRVCLDYCPIYELPNVFTPNGDDVNDLFVPIENPKYRYVKSIDMTIYNRWGEVVFKTNNPEILWDGSHQYINNTTSDSRDLVGYKEVNVKSGVYFYHCIVNELSLDGIKPRIIKGTVTVIDSHENDFK